MVRSFLCSPSGDGVPPGPWSANVWTAHPRSPIGRTAATLAILLVVVVTAGCGGSTPSSYTLAATKSCIQRTAGMKALPVDTGGMNVGPTPPGGTLNVQVGENTAAIAFGRTPSDAERMRAQVELVVKAFGSTTADVLSTDRNVVLFWDAAPTSGQRTLVTDCLSA